MRKFVIFLLVVGAGYWVYKNPEETRRKAGTALKTAGTYIYNLSNKWLTEDRSHESASFVPTEPSLNELAEEVYVLKQPLSYTSSTGPAFIPAGAELRKVGEGNGRLVLSHDGGQVVVEAHQVTRDPMEAVAIRKRTAQTHNHAVSQGLARLQTELNQVLAEITTTKKELADLEKRDAAARAMGRPIHMKTSTDFVRTKLVRLEGRASELRTEMTASPRSASN